jgi:PPOX class probable F420-dependent enzyme
MPIMTEAQWKAFVQAGTRTGKLATVREDGRPHVMPVWFVLDGEDLVFITGAESVKGRNLKRSGRCSICVDDERPPFAFVTISGTVELDDDIAAVLPWSTQIAERYMGAALADVYGRRNASAGELLVRLHAERVVATDGVAD